MTPNVLQLLQDARSRDHLPPARASKPPAANPSRPRTRYSPEAHA